MNIIIPYMIQIHKNNKTHKNDESSRASFFSKLYNNNNNNAIFNKNFFRFTTIFVHTTALTIPTISFFLYCTYFLPHYFVFSRVHKTIPIILTNNSFLIYQSPWPRPPPLSHTATPTVLTKYSFLDLNHLTNSSCVKHPMWKGYLWGQALL